MTRKEDFEQMALTPAEVAKLPMLEWYLWEAEEWLKAAQKSQSRENQLFFMRWAMANLRDARREAKKKR